MIDLIYGRSQERVLNMTTRTIRLLCTAAMLALAGTVAALDGSQAQIPGAAERPAPRPLLPQANGVHGIWVDHTGQGAVEVYDCGPNLCGRVYWIKAPLDARGRHLTDKQNPDAAKRSKPMCGLQIIGNLVRRPDGTWDNGWIYNPEDGGTFNVEIRLHNADTLQVRGFLGIKLLGETFLWKRAPANISPCVMASN